MAVYYDYETVHRKISVADQVTIPLNGTDYTFDVIGFNHDAEFGGNSITGCAGITFQMHDCFATTYPMNSTNTNSGGWHKSNMRDSTMMTMARYMPTAWQNIIRQVKKPSGTGGGSTSGINISSDYCFLLAEIEIFGSISNSVSGEGTQYAYYKAGNSKVKNVGGSAAYWWERSPRSDSSAYFCGVHKWGGAYAGDASNALGVAFGFCV